MVLLRSGPGSITMRSLVMPASRARSIRAARYSRTSSTTSSYCGKRYGSLGRASEWHRITLAPPWATTSTMRGSDRPVVSLMMSAPAEMAAAATSAWKVSTDSSTSGSCARSASTTGTTRSSSWSTGSGPPGANLTPPTSMMSAPSAAAAIPAATAAGKS